MLSSKRRQTFGWTFVLALVSHDDSLHDGECRAVPDLALPVPHHLAGGVAVHAAAEGGHAAPGHLGGVGHHPGGRL